MRALPRLARTSAESDHIASTQQGDGAEDEVVLAVADVAQRHEGTEREEAGAGQQPRREVAPQGPLDERQEGREQAQDDERGDSQQRHEQKWSDARCVDQASQDGRVEVDRLAVEEPVRPRQRQGGEELHAGAEAAPGDVTLRQDGCHDEGPEEGEHDPAVSTQGQRRHRGERDPAEDDGQRRALRAGGDDPAIATSRTGPRRAPGRARSSSTIEWTRNRVSGIEYCCEGDRGLNWLLDVQMLGQKGTVTVVDTSAAAPAPAHWLPLTRRVRTAVSTTVSAPIGRIQSLSSTRVVSTPLARDAAAMCASLNQW